MSGSGEATAWTTTVNDRRAAERGQAGPDGWRDAWVAALDALEADVETVERMISDEHRFQDVAAAPWAPPGPQIGPIPPDLRNRADDILARQLAAARASAAAITTNRRQQAFAARVEAGSHGKSVPSYVDRAV